MKGDLEPSEEEAISAVRGYFDQELKEAGPRLPSPRRPVRKPRSIPRTLASAAMLVVAAIVAAGILVLVTGFSPGQPAPAEPAAGTPSAAASVPSATASVPSTAAGTPSPTAGPRVAVQLAEIDLPGPVYDLAFDRARTSLWYAVMSEGQAVLYRYDIASGKTTHWSLPPTSHNGFLERVAVAPDGSVWVTEDYSVVRVDPETGSMKADTFPLADPDAIPAALDQSPSPGTWPSAITFDSRGMALVARHNVKSLTRLDSSLSVINRIQLPAGMVGPGDLVDSASVIYAAPYGGNGPGVLVTEQGQLVGSTSQPVSRFSVHGTSVAAIGSAGLSRVSSDATSTLWHAGLYGSPNDRLALTDGGAALWQDGRGTIEWISPDGGVGGQLTLAAVPIQVWSPVGELVTGYARDQVGAIAADGAGSVWYVDITSKQLVHIAL